MDNTVLVALISATSLLAGVVATQIMAGRNSDKQARLADQRLATAESIAAKREEEAAARQAHQAAEAAIRQVERDKALAAQQSAREEASAKQQADREARAAQQQAARDAALAEQQALREAAALAQAERREALLAERLAIQVAAQWAREQADKQAQTLAAKREEFLGWVLLSQRRMEDLLAGRSPRSSREHNPASDSMSPAAAARQAYAVALLYLDALRPLAKAFYQSSAQLQIAIEDGDNPAALQQVSIWRKSYSSLEEGLL